MFGLAAEAEVSVELARRGEPAVGAVQRVRNVGGDHRRTVQVLREDLGGERVPVDERRGTRTLYVHLELGRPEGLDRDGVMEVLVASEQAPEGDLKGVVAGALLFFGFDVEGEGAGLAHLQVTLGDLDAARGGDDDRPAAGDR